MSIDMCCILETCFSYFTILVTRGDMRIGDWRHSHLAEVSWSSILARGPTNDVWPSVWLLELWFLGWSSSSFSPTLGGSRWKGERHGGNRKGKECILVCSFFHLSIIVDAWRLLLLLSVLPWTSFLTSFKGLGRKIEDNKEVGGT